MPKVAARKRAHSRSPSAPRRAPARRASTRRRGALRGGSVFTEQHIEAMATHMEDVLVKSQRLEAAMLQAAAYLQDRVTTRFAKKIVDMPTADIVASDGTQRQLAFVLAEAPVAVRHALSLIERAAAAARPVLDNPPPLEAPAS
jgi:hypothetical protein